MFRFIDAGPTGGDYTAPYDIMLDRKYTVGEFIDTVYFLVNGDTSESSMGLSGPPGISVLRASPLRILGWVVAHTGMDRSSRLTLPTIFDFVR